jgi:uncharacterized protein
MADSPTLPPPPIGSVGWLDLTIDNADEVRDFYARVVGWVAAPLSMGEYNDYVMSMPETGKSAAGICHARGQNAGLPAAWLLYITVADLDASLRACEDAGGTVIAPTRNAGGSARYAVVRDPAGAAVALYDAGVPR